MSFLERELEAGQAGRQTGRLDGDDEGILDQIAVSGERCRYPTDTGTQTSGLFR